MHALGQPFQFLPATPIFIPSHFNFHSNSSHSNFLPCMLLGSHSNFFQPFQFSFQFISIFIPIPAIPIFYLACSWAAIPISSSHSNFLSNPFNFHSNSSHSSFLPCMLLGSHSNFLQPFQSSLQSISIFIPIPAIPISYLACSWAAILRGAASTPPHPHAPACCLYRRASCSASLATCSLYDAWSGCGRTKGACCCGQILTCMLLGLSSQYH